MFALEIETTIDNAGNIHLPGHYRNIFGKTARPVVLLPDEDSAISAFTRASEPLLVKVWDNQDDAAYDNL